MYTKSVRMKLPHHDVGVAGVPSQKGALVWSSGCAFQWKLGSNVEGRHTTSKLITAQTSALSYLGYTEIETTEMSIK